MYHGTAGQVLGASTAVVAGASGVYMLPDTGIDHLAMVLPIVAISVGSSVLLTLVATRIIKLIR